MCQKYIVSWFIAILFCVCHLRAQSQTIEWADNPGKTFVFEISNNEAEKLVQSAVKDSLFLKMLHHPVGSFSGEWNDAPKQGHFIFAEINRNKINYRYVPIMPFQVFLFKEYGVLTLQIIDSEGKIRSNAKVRIRKFQHLFDTHIDFDKTTQTYTIDDWSENPNRILTVELDKFRAVFDLNKHIINPWYGSNYNSGYSPDFYSYMITDKNKYKPGETVRFKSYALSGSKRPLKNNLEVWMKTDKKYDSFKKFGEITPYHPGGFAGEIQLHDSLKLTLDQNYTIQLRDSKGRIASSVGFRYEDYELYDNHLEVKLKENIQYFPDTNQVEIKVVDANGLILPDMKIDFLIKRRSIIQSYNDILIVPDTVLYKQFNLDNTDFTTIDIPASLFANADGIYEIEIVALSPDNQRMVYKNFFHFFKFHFNVEYSFRNDTAIGFQFKVLGKEKSVKAKLSYNDSKTFKDIELPYEEPFSQTVNSYRIAVPDYDYEQMIPAFSLKPELDLSGGIKQDSFNVQLVNPQKLEVSWYIYQGNRLLEKGSGTKFDFSYPNTNLELVHYVELFYFMGNEEKVFRRAFVPKTEYLSIDVDLPKRIYPGQTVDATIQVKDHLGVPVKNADITAFAVNSLLGYYIPDLPYYGNPPQSREQRSSYDIRKKGYGVTYPLDFKFWNRLAGLDTLPYYQFTYPWHKLFKQAINTPDSITQFAPYVMKNGNAVNIYVIECNSEPVYFSWTEQPKTYSFAVSASTHRISLRLHDRLLVIDSISFEAGKKTILSLDLDYLPSNVKSVNINAKDAYGNFVFTAKEIEKMKTYISKLPVANNKEFVYLAQKNLTYPIYHSCWSTGKKEITIGPFPQGITRYMNGVDYRHEGGFSYQFDGNVVYKYPMQTHPSTLVFSFTNNLNNLNDFYLTEKVFKSMTEKCQRELNRWFPKNIFLAQDLFNLKFRLPVEKDSTGVSNLLFHDRTNNKIFFPNKLVNGNHIYSQITAGKYDVILLYNNGKYLEYENVPIIQNAYTEVNMEKCPLHEADSLSEEWLLLRFHSGTIGTEPPTVITTSYYSKPIYQHSIGNVIKGYVLDEEKEPIIGAVVRIKGTEYGTITNMDGYFEIVADKYSTLEFSYLGYEQKEISTYPGSELYVEMKPNVMALEEVVVVGYGIRGKSNLTGSLSGISITGDSPDPQSPPEKLEDTKMEETAAEEKLYNDLILLNGLRTNFSDVGFWKPDLYTDHNGKAEFSVTFPDNITRWDAVVYAMNSKLKTGTFRQSVQSFKPIMAELKTPQFLVVGDTSHFSGNIRNYTKEKEIEGNIRFSVGNDTIFNTDIHFESSHQDLLPVIATETDSLSATYLFTRNDGYNDGEKRSIPVEPQGTEIAEGTLSILRNGDKITAVADEGEELHIQLNSKQLEVYLQVTDYLTGYKYACNEQLASKLIGLLTSRLYAQYLDKKFKHDKNVLEIIKRLLSNQNKHKLWSWWGNSSNTVYWLSAHVLNALRMAKEAGYPVALDISKIEQDYMDTQSFRAQSLNDIEILHALSEWETAQNYETAVNWFEKEIRKMEHIEDSIAAVKPNYLRFSYLNEKLLLWDIRRKQHLNYTSDSIAEYLKKDILGAVYCDDGLQKHWYRDGLATTLLAYQMIRNDSTLHSLKEAMQIYILGTKQTGWNTYRSASAVSTIFPDLLTEMYSKEQPAILKLSGKENRQITEFPYQTLLHSGENLQIEKQAGAPLFYSSYRWKRVKEVRNSAAFEISTQMDSSILTTGTPITLTVEVKVKQKNAEYVMIEIPIPAGCSYASKMTDSYRNYEVHREYFKEKTVIFCEKLPEGTYQYKIQLLPRYSGNYTLNPAKVELMYFPAINANNGIEKVQISEHNPDSRHKD